MEAKPRVRVAADLALVFAFAAFLMIPLVGTFCDWDVYEVEEKRRLAPFPDLAATSLTELPDAVEAYYVDHFGFRNFCIRRWNRLLRRLDKNLVRRVIHGRDDWLFYDRPEIMLDFLGRVETTDEDLEYWRSAIEGRNSWLAERGIHHLFAVAPNKASVYPEMLPEDLRAAARPTRLDRLVAYMAAHSDVPLLDLRHTLREHKGWKTLYLSNDSHWNEYGMFVAYRTVVTRVREWLPHLDPPLELSECRLRSYSFLGDLAKLADLPRDEYTIERHLIDPPTLRQFEISVFDDPVFPPPGPRLDDNTRRPVYRNPSGRGRAVVFHDSFFITATGLVAHHFAETTCIPGGLKPEVLTAVVEKQKPEVVIEVVGERLLQKLPHQSEAWEEARRRRRGSEAPERK